MRRPGGCGSPVWAASRLGPLPFPRTSHPATPLEESHHAELLQQSESEHLRTKRQVIEVQVEQTGTSCGYGVPVMDFVRERRVADRGRRYKDRKK